MGWREGEKDVEKVFEAAELSLIHRAPESGSHYQKIQRGGGGEKGRAGGGCFSSQWFEQGSKKCECQTVETRKGEERRRGDVQKWRRQGEEMR